MGASVDICSPQDTGWTTIKSVATSGSSTPYNPTSTSGILLSMLGFTGVCLRAKYTSNMTVSPVAVVWGRKGSQWSLLLSATGVATATLASTTATNQTDGTYFYTNPSEQFDALGSEVVTVTLATAATTTGATTTIEATRF